MHEPTFQNALASAGLNPYYFQMANIRKHVSWVVEDHLEATEKAKRLAQAAVARVELPRAPLPRQESVTPAALVVGGGIAGIQAALTHRRRPATGSICAEQQPSIGGHWGPTWIRPSPRWTAVPEFSAPG